jgi:hypothetical protein
MIHQQVECKKIKAGFPDPIERLHEVSLSHARKSTFDVEYDLVIFSHQQKALPRDYILGRALLRITTQLIQRYALYVHGGQEAEIVRTSLITKFFI